MKAIVPYQHIFSIVGIPRSGTSIVNTVFNSLENGFSISEPISGMFDDPSTVTSGKSNFQVKTNPYHMFRELNEHMIFSKEYDLAGIKEVFDPNRDAIDIISKSEYINFHVIIIRNPLNVFNSWFVCNWKDKFNKVEYLRFLYENLYSFYKTEFVNKPIFVINYDILISYENKIDYLNKVFDGYIKFIDNFVLFDSKFSRGDPKGLTSISVDDTKKALLPQVLNPHNFNYINNHVVPIYNEILNQ